MIKHGLKPIRLRRTDFSWHRTFGAFSASSLPENYDADAHLTMPDQNAEGLPLGCTGETTTDICTDEDFEIYDPKDLFDNTPPNDPTVGRDIRDALKVAITRGPRKKDGTFGDKRTAYFNVESKGVLDFFDACRVVLWATAMEKRSISIGTPWYPDWSSGILGKDGIMSMPKNLNTQGLPWHNWKISGWVTIDNIPYLLCKSWQGTGYGVNGIARISRDVINKVMKIYGTGAFTLSKVAKGQVYTMSWGMLEMIVDFIHSIIDQFNQVKTPAPLPVIPVNTPETPQPPTSPMDNLLKGLIYAESRGDVNCIGDKNIPDHAYGCLQIRIGVLSQVNALWKTNYKVTDLLGKDGCELSKKVCVDYFLKIVPQYKVWKAWVGDTQEFYAKSWNGGIGWQKNFSKKGYERYTKGITAYWNTVKNHMTT